MSDLPRDTAPSSLEGNRPVFDQVAVGRSVLLFFVLVIFPKFVPLCLIAIPIWLVSTTLILKIQEFDLSLKFLGLFGLEISKLKLVTINFLSLFVLFSSIREFIPSFRKGKWFDSIYIGRFVIIVSIFSILIELSWSIGILDILVSPERGHGNTKSWSGAVEFFLFPLSSLGAVILAERVRVFLDRPPSAGKGSFASIVNLIKTSYIGNKNIQCSQIDPLFRVKGYDDIIIRHKVFGDSMGIFLAPCKEASGFPFRIGEEAIELFNLLEPTKDYYTNYLRFSPLIHPDDVPYSTTSVSDRMAMWLSILTEAREHYYNGCSLKNSIDIITAVDCIEGSIEEICRKQLARGLLNIIRTLEDCDGQLYDDGLFLLSEKYTRDAIIQSELVFGSNYRLTIDPNTGGFFLKIPLLRMAHLLASSDAYERIWNRPIRTYPFLGYIIGNNPHKSIIRRYIQYSDPTSRCWAGIKDYWQSTECHLNKINNIFSINEIINDAIAIKLLEPSDGDNNYLLELIHNTLWLYDIFSLDQDAFNSIQDKFIHDVAINIMFGPGDISSIQQKNNNIELKNCSEGLLGNFNKLLLICNHIALKQQNINDELFSPVNNGLLVYTGTLLKNFEQAICNRSSRFFKIQELIYSSLWNPWYEPRKQGIKQNKISNSRVVEIINSKLPPNRLGFFIHFSWPVLLLSLAWHSYNKLKESSRSICGIEWSYFRIIKALYYGDWLTLAKEINDFESPNRFLRLKKPNLNNYSDVSKIDYISTRLESPYQLRRLCIRLQRVADHDPGNIPLKTTIGIVFLLRAMNGRDYFNIEARKWLKSASALCENMKTDVTSEYIEILNHWDSACDFYLFRSFDHSFMYNPPTDLLIKGFYKSKDEILNNRNREMRISIPYNYSARINKLKLRPNDKNRHILFRELWLTLWELKILCAEVMDNPNQSDLHARLYQYRTIVYEILSKKEYNEYYDKGFLEP